MYRVPRAVSVVGTVTYHGPATPLPVADSYLQTGHSYLLALLITHSSKATQYLESQHICYLFRQNNQCTGGIYFCYFAIHPRSFLFTLENNQGVPASKFDIVQTRLATLHHPECVHILLYHNVSYK